MIYKVCTKCSVEKVLTEFNKGKYYKGGHMTMCRMCQSITHQEYRAKDPDGLNNKSLLSYHRNKKLKGRPCLFDKKKYKKDNRNKINSYNRNRWKTDSLYRMKLILRARTWKAFNISKWTKSENTLYLLGAEYITVRKHIEGLFTDGMSWGKLGDIHIDHIIPLASATTEKDLIKLCHYTNLQPLWAEDNLRKGYNIKY